MDKKIKKRTHILYGLGVAYAMIDQIFNQWVKYFYLPSEAAIENYGMRVIMNPFYLALAFIIMRLVDAIADPVIGYLSDSSNSKIGRRSIYIFLGIIPLGISMVAFFYPLNQGSVINLFYLSIIGSIYFIVYTMVGGPYNALIADIARNKEERLSLSTAQSVFRLIFTALPLIFSPILINVVMKKYSMSYANSLRTVIIFFSTLSVLLVFTSIFFLKESKITNKKNTDGEKMKFKDCMKYLYDKEIILYFIGFFFFFTGFNIIRNSVLYYMSSILGKSEKDAFLPIAILFIVAAVFFPITQSLCKKISYKKVMLMDIALVILGTLLLITIARNNINVFYLAFVIVGMGISGAAFIFPPAVLSEISNLLFEKYNIRIEGIMFGVQGLFLKLALLLELATTTLILPFRSSNGGASKIGVELTLVLALVFLSLSFISYFLKKDKI